MRRGGGQGRSRTAGPSTRLTAPCRLCAAGDLRRRREPPHADHPFRAPRHESAKGSHAPSGRSLAAGPWHGRCFTSTPPTRASSPPLTGPPRRYGAPAPSAIRGPRPRHQDPGRAAHRVSNFRAGGAARAAAGGAAGHPARCPGTAAGRWKRPVPRSAARTPATGCCAASASCPARRRSGFAT